MPTVGLFGTCGGSRWREPFEAAFRERGIPYFNPQLPEGTWTPESIPEEHRHLTEDEIVVFPVTDETTAVGSLGEVGFSVMTAIDTGRGRLRHVIVMIAPDCNAPGASPEAIKDSVRGRKLVRSRVAEEASRLHNVHLVDTLEEALALTLRLWPAIELLATVAAEKRA